MKVYHCVPKAVWGDTLYPLNNLETLNPELYAQQVKKYAGREQVTEQHVPILGCLWNDVLYRGELSVEQTPIVEV